MKRPPSEVSAKTVRLPPVQTEACRKVSLDSSPQKSLTDGKQFVTVRLFIDGNLPVGISRASAIPTFPRAFGHRGTRGRSSAAGRRTGPRPGGADHVYDMSGVVALSEAHQLHRSGGRSVKPDHRGLGGRGLGVGAVQSTALIQHPSEGAAAAAEPPPRAEPPPASRLPSTAPQKLREDRDRYRVWGSGRRGSHRL